MANAAMVMASCGSTDQGVETNSGIGASGDGEQG